MQRNAEAKINLLDMKKILFTGILSILFVGISFAQSPRIGITAGLNVSNVTTVTNNISNRMDWKAGFQVGVVSDFGISKSFSIIPELLFSQRGTKYNSSANNGSSITLNYLQLPINAAYKFDVGMGSKLFIFAGPYVGYGLSGSALVPVKFSSKEQDYKNIGVEDLNMYFKPFDFGINAGVGYEYEKIFFKVQYNHGFANYSNDKNTSWKNLNIGVSAGYFFN